MPQNVKSILPLASLLVSGTANAFDQSFESCAMSAYVILEATTDYMLGVPLSKARASCFPGNPDCNVPRVYREAKKEGIDHAYISGHVYMIKCGNKVPKRTDATSLAPAEAAYKSCLSDGAVRLNVIAAIRRGDSQEAAMAAMGAQYGDIIRAMYKIVKEANVTKALSLSAGAFNSCVESVDAAKNGHR